MVDFKQKVVLITGAVGNLGSAVARAFLAAGANLALSDRSMERTAKTFDDLSKDEHLFTSDTDITNEGSVAAMIKQVLDRFGRIDCLVNTVGGFRAGMPVHDTPLDVWQLMLDLNAKSIFLTSRATIPSMLEHGSGSIINIASEAGLKAGVENAAYSASKSAVIRLTEGMAAELKDKGINVNCVIPGTIDTQQNRQAMPNAETSLWVKPESLAEVILFLASSSARDIHGVVLPVTGRA